MLFKRRKTNKRFNRAVILSTVLAILVFTSVSTTIAFLITGTDPITNIFVPSKVTTEVRWVDNSAEDTGKNARIRNTSDIPIYVRAAVTVNWVKEVTDEDGNVTRHIHSESPVGCHPDAANKEGFDYTIVYNGVTWLKKEYGNGEVIYYYINPVLTYNAEGTDRDDRYTTNLISQFKSLGTNPPEEGYELVVEVVGSGIQSTPIDVVQDKWGVAVDNAGIITAVN